MGIPQLIARTEVFPYSPDGIEIYASIWEYDGLYTVRLGSKKIAISVYLML